MFVVSAGLTFVTPGIRMTPEMLSRTTPSFFDVIIALSCGAIGAYSFVNKRVSSAISGVAISVALMPPLCTVGIGIGLTRWEMVQNAALLYSINLTGISMAALIVFYLVRLHPKADDKTEFGKARVRTIGALVISGVIIVLISIPLVFFMITAYDLNYRKEVIYSSIRELLPYDRIYSLEIEGGQHPFVEMVLLHKQSSASIAASGIKNHIEAALGKEVDLDLYYIYQSDFDDGEIITGEVSEGEGLLSGEDQNSEEIKMVVDN